MKFLNHIPSWLRNKYFISFAAFCVIILFFDKNDLFTQISRRKELGELEQSKKYYSSQFTTESKDFDALITNPSFIEKHVREKFLMKRDNEELFLVPEKSDLAPDETKN